MSSPADCWQAGAADCRAAELQSCHLRLAGFFNVARHTAHNDRFHENVSSPYILLECKETCKRSNRLLVNSLQGWKSDSRLRAGDHPADGYFCPAASTGWKPSIPPLCHCFALWIHEQFIVAESLTWQEPRQTLPAAVFTVLDSIKLIALKLFYFFSDLIYSKQVMRQRCPSGRLSLDWKEKHEYENKDTLQSSSGINGGRSLRVWRVKITKWTFSDFRMSFRTTVLAVTAARRHYRLGSIRAWCILLRLLTILQDHWPRS